MRTNSQVMMIVTAIAFAVALALVVSLIYISYLKISPLPEDATTPPVDPAPDEPTDATQNEHDSTPIGGNATDPPDVTPNTGLCFESLGNGTCVLVGVGSCTDACVVIPEYAPNGERVVEIASRAFFGCSTLTAVQIPASVTKIGVLAFASCQNLLFVSVDADNQAYCDISGVLFTRDLRVLLIYPPHRAQAECPIPRQTVEICEMAFFQCPYLQKIRFEGSAEEWDMIRIGAKNYSLTAAAKQFCAVP